MSIATAKEITNEDLTELALSTIRSVLGDVRYQYLSGPITGGCRVIEWHETVGRDIPADGYKKARRASVDLNIADVRAAAALERRSGRPTIEPGSFEANFPQWGQREFLAFWEQVIKHHASSVRFMDGWQFSAGCTFEYLCARRERHSTLTMAGGPLEPADAVSMIDEALVEIEERFDFTDQRDRAMAELHANIRSYRDLIEAVL